MENRIELNGEELENIVGGALTWSAKGVYCNDDPDTVYSFKSYSACRAWIQENWKNKPQNAALLQALQTAGLVHKK